MIPFSPPRIDQRIIDEVSGALRSGWITTGPKTRQLEENLASFCGNPATRCLASATAGLELILRWFGVKAGDEVIVPAYTYCATANVVEHCGARPVMVDVNEDFLMDPAEVEKAMSHRTKAVIPVDFGGMPCDYDALYSILRGAGRTFGAESDVQERLGRALLLADAAHSFGARYGGRRSGVLADVSVFSFHAVKNLTTAEGGAVALNLPAPFDNEAVRQFLGVFSLHGQDRDALSKQQAGGWKYDVTLPGYKCNMTDVQAAIGIVELDRYDTETLPRRKAICDAYTAAFSSKPWARVPVQRTADAESSYHLYPLRIAGIGEPDRDGIVQAIFDRGVSVNVHFIPLPLLSYYRESGYLMTDFPVAYRNYACEISLPVYYDLQDSQVAEVVDAVAGAVEAFLVRRQA